MTLEDTRRLGIEFERRVQTMIPDKEFLDKLDTDTIYSYLNQYQDRYIHEIFRNLDNILAGTKLLSHIDSTLQSLLVTETVDITDTKAAKNYTENIIDVSDGNGISIIDTARSVKYKLDNAFYMYLRSVSNVCSTYSFKANSNRTNSNAAIPIRILPNQLVSQSDVWKLVETPHDSLRILRYPAAILTENDVFNGKPSPTLTVIYDRYTTPLGIKVTYYKQPCHFDIMTSTACELPLDAFEELVSGAVDLYVQYVAGAEANKRRIELARQLAARDQERSNRRRRNDEEDED